jgi:hypothetical protein
MRLSDGRVLGLALWMSTTNPLGTTTLRGATQQIKNEQVSAYLRDGRTTTPRWFYISGAEETALDWTSDHLRNHGAAYQSGGAFSIDLSFDIVASRWTGTMHYADSSGKVLLVRPNGAAPNAPVGTRGGGQDEGSCLHIAVGSDGQLVVLDSLRQPALNDRAPVFEEYGDRAPFSSIPKQADDQWQFAVGNFAGGVEVVGRLSAAGAIFAGTQRVYSGLHAPGNPPLPFTWHRVQGDSCRQLIAAKVIPSTGARCGREAETVAARGYCRGVRRRRRDNARADASPLARGAMPC